MDGTTSFIRPRSVDTIEHRPPRGCEDYAKRDARREVPPGTFNIELHFALRAYEVKHMHHFQRTVAFPTSLHVTSAISLDVESCHELAQSPRIGSGAREDKYLVLADILWQLRARSMQPSSSSCSTNTPTATSAFLLVTQKLGV